MIYIVVFTTIKCNDFVFLLYRTMSFRIQVNLENILRMESKSI